MKSVSKEKYLLHTKLETARTILAFLWREKLNEVAELFIKTCPYLEFERNAIEEGYAPFNFAYQPISEILHDYSQTGRKLSQLVQRYGCDLSFQRTMTDLEKVEYLLEFQSNRTTFVPDDAVQSGDDATGVPQNVTIGQTLTTNQEMFSQHPDGGTYPQNETVSFMIIPDYDGSGPGGNQYTQGATVSTVDNYTMSAASNASVYSETPAVIPNEGSNESVPTHYVLYDDNGNEQQIMIELIPEGNSDISGPDDATQTIQTTPLNDGFQAPQCATSSYTMPSIQTEHAVQPLHHSISVGETLSVHTNSNTASGNQNHLPAQENNQLLMVASHQVQQVQTGQIQTMNLGEQVTTGSVAGCIDVQSAGQQENMNDVVTRKPYHNPPESTVTVTTTINQQKVVTRLQDIRRSLCMERPALADTVSSTTPQKPPRIPTVPVPCQSRNITSKAVPSSAMKKSKAATQADTVENQPPPNVGNSTVSTEAAPIIDPAVSALEEWKRIRSTNRSNFDNIVRQEISRDIDQQDQEKSIQMRERKKAALRLAKLRKKMVTTEPPEQRVEPVCETSAKPAARKTKQRTRAAAAKREASGSTEQPNSVKPAARKRKQRAPSVTAKRTKRSSIETVANANDSLEKNAALLEAALYTPMKPDTEQPEQQQQQQPMESGNKKLGTPVPQTVSFTLTPAQQMPIEATASVLENQTEALPRQEAYQTVQQEPVPQPVDCSLALDTSVTNPSPGVKENVNITVAQHTQPTPSVAMDTAPHAACESPLKFFPPAAQPETAESRAEPCAPQAQDETEQAVASITALAPSTPCKVKVVPIARKHLSTMKRSASSDTSSSDSSSDSDCNSSCSSSNSSTTMEEDENIRQMYENTKRYRDGKRIKQPSTLREQAATIVPSKSPRKQNVIRVNGAKACERNKPQNGPPEPGGVGGNDGGGGGVVSDSLKTPDSEATTATLSRIKVVTNRQQNTVKLVQPKPQLPKQAAKQRPDPKPHTELTSPIVAPQTVPVQSAPTKKVKSPTPTEKAAVATPTRTKTPRKQQLIPTKLDSNDTFIPPTSPRVPQRPAQKSPQRPVRNRYAPARLSSALNATEKRKGTKVQRAQKADAQRMETGPVEPEEQTVDDKQQENAPVNVVVPVPTKTTASSPKVLKPEATVCEDAIYAVLAQIHGK